MAVMMSWREAERAAGLAVAVAVDIRGDPTVGSGPSGFNESGFVDIDRLHIIIDLSPGQAPDSRPAPGRPPRPAPVPQRRGHPRTSPPAAPDHRPRTKQPPRRSQYRVEALVEHRRSSLLV
jgi:hypothetical protein